MHFHIIVIYIMIQIRFNERIRFEFISMCIIEIVASALGDDLKHFYECIQFVFNLQSADGKNQPVLPVAVLFDC